MDKAKFIVHTLDENCKRFIPVDCIGSVVVVKGMDRQNGADTFGIMLGNKYGEGEAVMTFKTETQRDEKLAEILDKMSVR